MSDLACRWAKAPLGSGKDLSIFTIMYFHLLKTAVESVANFAGIETLTIAYKEAGRGEEEWGDRRADKRLLIFSWSLGHVCDWTDPREMEAL